MRRRLDQELVRRGLAASREQAQDDIRAGRVTVSGSVAEKPARLVGAGEPVVVAGERAPRFVGRGGEKLDAALDRFAIDVAGKEALDAGASTGGFTDCLLRRGALHVVAVDVGRGQIHERLRADPRVTVLDRTNVRHLTLGSAGRPDRPFPLLVGDLSFISLRTVAHALVGLVGPSADLVLLVKPQFEAGRVEAARGRGVIEDPAVWEQALTAVRSALENEGAAMMEVMVSPILGAAGNAEFLVHFRTDAATPAGDRGLRRAIESARLKVSGDSAGAEQGSST